MPRTRFFALNPAPCAWVVGALLAAALAACGGGDTDAPLERADGPTVVEGRLVTAEPPLDVFIALYEGSAAEQSPDYVDQRDELNEVSEDGRFALRAERRAGTVSFYVYANISTAPYSDVCVYEQLPAVRVAETGDVWVDATTRQPLPLLTLTPTQTTACY